MPLRTLDDPEMGAAMKKARESWPKFVEAFRKKEGDSFSVKIEMWEGDQSEHIWVSVTKIEGDTIHGALGNRPVYLKKLELGSPVTGKAKDVSDWLYMKDGKMVGGYTVRILLERQKRKQQEKQKQDK